MDGGDNLLTLCNMGFDCDDSKRALAIAKGDMNEAVAILTGDQLTSGYEGYDLDAEMKETGSDGCGAPSGSKVFGPQLPPTYDEVVDASKDDLSRTSSHTMTEGTDVLIPMQDKDEPFEFPVANLYELENRVFTESWSIPYKKEESLGKCLYAAIRLARDGLCDSDTHCRQFFDKCLPESFSKLLTSPAVHRWASDIQEGIFDMVQLFVELIAYRMQHEPIPTDLLQTLATVFDIDNEYNTKNKNKITDKNWDQVFGPGKSYAVSLLGYKEPPYGWLTDVINQFAEKNGFHYIKERLEGGNADAPALAALLNPFGVCTDLLNPDVVRPMLADGIDAAIKYAESLDAMGFKEKKVGSICEMLATCKLLCLTLWKNRVEAIDSLRLQIVLKMIKSPHFNAKMNALKELTRMIDDSLQTRVVRCAIDQSKILDWLVEEKILSIALEGNIDQVQYCDKIKNIVDFLGPRLSVEELSVIWNIQNGETTVVIDNIHSIVAAAAIKFNPSQLECLVQLVTKSWQEDNDILREKLLRLIGGIGRDTKNVKTTLKVLELLWDLAHLPTLKTTLTQLALEEHHAILNDSFTIKDATKKDYAIQCVNDIKEGKWVLPALKQLLLIAKSIAKTSFHKAEKGILLELNSKYDIIRQVTTSLKTFHHMAAQAAKNSELGCGTIVDGRYTHYEFVTVHLSFLQFILQEGSLYLHWHRARDIWDTLAGNAQASDWDRETCYEWFCKGILDLEQETQMKLFQNELLKLDPSRLTEKGFQCFKCFFETVNVNENKLQRTGVILTVEKPDLIGLDFLWKICLNMPDNDIAESAITLLLNVSYLHLAPRLKKDPSSLHKKFIDECNNWLELAMQPLEGSVIASTLLDATKLLAAIGLPQGVTLPLPSRSTANLLNVERLLLIAERYIVCVEELHSAIRAIPSHGASFQGHPLNLHVTCESYKQDFHVQAHSNESVGSLRLKIARHMKLPVEQIQFVPAEKVPNRDQKLLNQLNLDVNQSISIRVISTTNISSSFPSSADLSATSQRHSLELEEEKMLPGVIMSNGGQVFQMLYHLAGLDQPKITSRARSLLNLIPTDPSVVGSLDSISHKSTRLAADKDSSSGGGGAAAPPSPKTSPRKPVLSSNLSLSSSLGLHGSTSSLKHSTLSRSVTPPSSVMSLVGGSGGRDLGKKLSPNETLKHLLGATSPGVSMFQVLYSLEVLSSRLMPTLRDTASVQSARKFCDEFLEANGFALIVNILQKDVIQPDVDYETRQGCYSVSLQLLRYLLCGEDVTGEVFQSTESGGRRMSTAGSTAVLGAVSSGAGSGPPSLEPVVITPAAGKTIQTMGVSEFTDTVSCFIRVTWAATAGKLQLVGSPQPIRDSTAMETCCGYSGRELSIGSTGSGTSSGSEGDLTCLHAGLCVKQKQVSSKDTYIAKEALELLVTCLQHRSSLLPTFYSLPFIGDFIVEVLVGSTQSEIREKALEQFYRLSQTQLTPEDFSGHQQTPLQFMLQTLLKARLPFWVSSTMTRGASHRLLRHCKQYFELLCKLLDRLTVDDQTRLQLNVSQMLEDEVVWLSNFVPSEDGVRRETDNTLLAGHLQLIRTLLTCDSVSKRDCGQALIHDLLHEFLFPASKLIMDSATNPDNNLASFTPKCSNSESRVAAYAVLVELANGNAEYLSIISKELISMHHEPNPELASQWEYMPPVDSRSAAGFVGLKNGGATCYMNSVLQQLYMTPGLPEYILGIDVENMDEESVLYQVQQVMGHLLESKLQYYVPEKFWQVFRLWGNAIRVQEQQDALDFFQALIDQIDEQTKKFGKEPICKKNFQGLYSDQKICKDCQHRYEQEEVFFSLSVTVKNATLQDSLDQFVKGELLEGENAYFCEKCGVKRNTVKRMCIKSLPPVLCIQLKRFDYDWESNRAIKFDDLFKFPFILDMEPYTAEGMAWREEMNQNKPDIDDDNGVKLTGSTSDMFIMDDHTSTTSAGETSDSSSTTPRRGKSGLHVAASAASASSLITAAVCATHINYELVGIVVHSGQANAGHYYSFIKDRRGNYMVNPNKGKWYKYNDTIVEEFEMTEAALEVECFGGKYRAKVYDNNSSNSNSEERLRYWNGYLLFYERMEDVRTPVSAKKSKVTMWRVPADKPSPRQDSLKQLTDLVHKGERKGIFSNKMPARIQQVVREENLHFMKNRNVYDFDYFLFVRKLASTNLVHTNHSQYTQLCVESLNLSIKFLFNTYFRTKTRLRGDLEDWCSLVATLLHQSKETCVWMVDFLAVTDNACIKPLLLECPTKDIRQSFGKLVERTMSSFFQHGGVATHKCFDEIIKTLLAMLVRDVPDNCKQSLQYFQVFSAYVQMGIKAISHMFGRGAFQRMMEFLIGHPITSSSSADQEMVRRWSSLQAREFGPLHVTLATLILYCDVTPYMTEDKRSVEKLYRPITIQPTQVLNMSTDMHRFVFGTDSARYINEVVLALRELNNDSYIRVIEDMVLYCCCYNLPFTMAVLRNIMSKCLYAPSNELKFLFQVLLRIMMIEDSLQLKRVKCVIDGIQGDVFYKVDGMLVAIKQNHTSDSRRSYQIIKFLVQLANKCPLAKDYILNTTTKWNWAVNWLKSKMSEIYWNQSAQSANMSNEDSTTNSFQRTISAQDTLAEATALLTELEAQDQSDMDIGGDGPGSSKEDDEVIVDLGSISKSSSPRVTFTTGDSEMLEDFGV